MLDFIRFYSVKDLLLSIGRTLVKFLNLKLYRFKNARFIQIFVFIVLNQSLFKVFIYANIKILIYTLDQLN